MKFALVCAYCRLREEASTAGRRCSECDGPFVVEVDRPALTDARDVPAEAGLPGIWRYLPLLPLERRDAIVSLHEGGTPLVAARRLGERIGVSSLFLKDESRNPTGSFKDRMLALGVSRAVELGKSTIVVQSSGNVAAAAAAYAAKAGLRAKIFVPRTVPEEKLLQIQLYGGDLFRIDHDSPAAVFRLMDEVAKALGWYVVSTTALYNPFTLEGARTIAYELFEQTGGELPEWIVVPVGGGGNLGTIWRAFRELNELGLVDRLPRMVGVQAEGCAPFVEAVRLGRSAEETAKIRWPEIRTVCGPIADDVVFDAHVALPAVRESFGTAVAVSDTETLDAEAMLARMEGVFVEPSSATTIAALRRLAMEGIVRQESSVCCILTGTGFKDMASARKIVSLPDLVAPTVEAVLDRAEA
ncbi:MAG TPA: threonine synthase [Vicinamibacteria bacterium]|nr:threonine synthase [Vicinamibacteria bacterium]